VFNRSCLTSQYKLSGKTRVKRLRLPTASRMTTSPMVRTRVAAVATCCPLPTSKLDMIIDSVSEFSLLHSISPKSALKPIQARLICNLLVKFGRLPKRMLLHRAPHTLASNSKTSLGQCNALAIKTRSLLTLAGKIISRIAQSTLFKAKVSNNLPRIRPKAL